MIAVAVKPIRCEHCSQSARLNVWPHPDAGLWECYYCGLSGVCEHPETHMEDVTVEKFVGPEMEAREWSGQVTVCNDCGITLDDEDDA